MQALVFTPLTRVLIERSSGDVESWIVLYYLDGHVVVGAEVPYQGEMVRATKHIPPRLLAEWQRELTGRPVEVRPAAEAQLELAVRWAEKYAEEEA